MFKKFRGWLRNLRKKVIEPFLPLSEEKLQERRSEKEKEFQQDNKMREIQIELYKQHCAKCERLSCRGCFISDDPCDNFVVEHDCRDYLNHDLEDYTCEYSYDDDDFI